MNGDATLSPSLRDHPLLRRLRAELERRYGPRLERLILFGSRARGDARPDSDWDVAVVLKDLGDYWEESLELADLGFDLMMETGAAFSLKPFTPEELEQRTLLMHNLRREGIDLTPEALDLLAKARTSLSNARRILQAGVADVAAREASMAAFHGAQAVLFERQGAVPKTHSGIHRAFGRLAKDAPDLGRALARFLPSAYRYKNIADYATRRTIAPVKAEEAIREAADFLAAIEVALGAGSGTGG